MEQRTRNQKDFGVGDSSDEGGPGHRRATNTRLPPNDDNVYGELDEYGDENDSVSQLKKQSMSNKANKTRGHRVDSEHSYRSSRLSAQTQQVNLEAMKQIAILEELAHQMREEKRQLQMDKERIEKERLALEEDRARTAHNMEAYVNDY